MNFVNIFLLGNFYQRNGLYFNIVNNTFSHSEKQDVLHATVVNNNGRDYAITHKLYIKYKNKLRNSAITLIWGCLFCPCVLATTGTTKGITFWALWAPFLGTNGLPMKFTTKQMRNGHLNSIPKIFSRAIKHMQIETKRKTSTSNQAQK